jgi:hypothetical protein
MPKKAHFAGVQRVKQRDAKGNVIAVRNYHRATKIRLPDDYGSPAFAIAWAKAETSAAVVTKAVSPPGDLRRPLQRIRGRRQSRLEQARPQHAT